MGTNEFKEKVRIKQKIVTAAVILGFKVLLTDVDVVFFKNPTHHLPTDYDLVIQDDMQKMKIPINLKMKKLSSLNSGFMLVSPSYAGVTMMQNTLNILMTKSVRQQPALNVVIRQMLLKNSLKVKILDIQDFP